ncbi:hypothetical protein KVR01_013045 [Diaporthe batatas]|uniref:uncharacterized protein n=1 Tax=Diaporthe batatas TaxID=748121 RepID=UPI001D0448A2|nr:uncharacterized protein KVR01_013045 [Diaporthe batatas]KAG8157055.1 hypothetical protein KVR01_013045 [Diaporthe batatas]
MAPTPTIQNSIPVRYDPRVVVKPCEPDRVPHLPGDILYMIAQALPQPKQVFNLALASKDTWYHLQPALYECEVTYEARLAHRYDIEFRVFKATVPVRYKPYHIAGAMTALHWASTRGASALPVAQRAIQAALVHQPSYINGLDLIRRAYYLQEDIPRRTRRTFGDHPPPLFIALAHGNLELFQALVDAGADLSLTLGRMEYYHCSRDISKIHSRCAASWPFETVPGACMFGDPIAGYEEPHYPTVCQTIGHLAIELGQTEVLEMLLRKGLDHQQTVCPLLHHAVLHGSLPAMKAILARDPGAVHGYYRDKTVLHMLPWTKPMADAEIYERKLESMASCLFEHGISPGAPARRYESAGFRNIGGDTALDEALKCLASFEAKECGHRAAIGQWSVNILVGHGSSWLPGDAANAHLEHVRRGILFACIKNIVLVKCWPGWYHNNSALWNSDFDATRIRNNRMFWGRTCQALIRQASEALARDAGGHGTEAIREILHTGFRVMVDTVDQKWQQAGIVGWWALEALGNLFLSTGMELCGETKRAWDRILKRDYKDPADLPEWMRPGVGLPGSIKKCEELDGDKSDWAFLLEGTTFKNPEGTFPPCDHDHMYTF